MNIVADDHLVIPGGNEILLQVIRAHTIREGFGRQCVLGQVAAGAPVRNNRWPVSRIHMSNRS